MKQKQTNKLSGHKPNKQQTYKQHIYTSDTTTQLIRVVMTLLGMKR